MNENTGFAIGTFPKPCCHPNRDSNATKINDGVENACLLIIDRIERTKESATDKELIDLCLCLSGLITAWNLASLRSGQGI